MIKLGLALRVTMTILIAKIATVVVTILVAKIAIAVAITLAVKIAIAVVILLVVKIATVVVTVQTRMTKVLDQIQVIQTLPLSLILERWCKHWKLTSLGKVKF